MSTTDQARRTLVQRARETFATYLCVRAELRSHGVSEAYLATLEAGEHAAWDLQEGLFAAAPIETLAPNEVREKWTGTYHWGLDVSGNCILGP